MNLPDPFACTDALECRGFVLVPEAFAAAECNLLATSAKRLLQRHSRIVSRRVGDRELVYTVVTGDHIRADASPLFDLYASAELLDWVRRVTKNPGISLSPHLRSAINVNCLDQAGHKYPWHTDAVPYTALLFLSSLQSGDGGELLMKAKDGEVVSVQPASGLFVLMDGALCAHSVSPLHRQTTRISVPMVYPARVEERPAGLDDFLYASASDQSG